MSKNRASRMPKPQPTSGEAATVPPDMEIVLRIPAGRVNAVLIALSKEPLAEIVDVWSSIRQQAERQVADFLKGPPPDKQ